MFIGQIWYVIGPVELWPCRVSQRRDFTKENKRDYELVSDVTTRQTREISTTAISLTKHFVKIIALNHNTNKKWIWLICKDSWLERTFTWKARLHQGLKTYIANKNVQRLGIFNDKKYK